MSYENLKTMLNNAVNIESTFVLPFVAATISGGVSEDLLPVVCY